MVDLPVPKAEAKPSTSDLPAEVLAEAVMEAARTLCRRRFSYAGPYNSPTGAAEHLERDARDTAEESWFRAVIESVAPMLISAGRSQAAEDIRREAEELPNLQIWSASTEDVVGYCARIAEGGGEADPSKDLPAPRDAISDEEFVEFNAAIREGSDG